MTFTFFSRLPKPVGRLVPKAGTRRKGEIVSWRKVPFAILSGELTTGGKRTEQAEGAVGLTKLTGVRRPAQRDMLAKAWSFGLSFLGRCGEAGRVRLVEHLQKAASAMDELVAGDAAHVAVISRGRDVLLQSGVEWRRLGAERVKHIPVGG